MALARQGPAPLSRRAPAGDASLRIAAVIPSFRRGSGGHATIVRLLEALRAGGHEVSVWLEDCEGRHGREGARTTATSFAEFFGADRLPLNTGFSSWKGADVVLATGWQTVPRALLLEGASGRAYLVQDHEPDFYGASAEATWAAQTYRQGLHCIAASEWLAELLRARYGASASHFDLAVDHAVYRQTPAPGSPSAQRAAAGRPAGAGAPLAGSVAFYARALTPRRAVPLGLIALEELHRRHPGVEIVLFGEDRPLAVSFAHRNLGVLAPVELAALYGTATVGMVFSLTNPSLIGFEMMACGLPCVELASDSMRATFAADGPLALAQPDPLSICGALQELLGDRARREEAARRGVELMAGRTWEHAAEQVESGLLTALGEHRHTGGPHPG